MPPVKGETFGCKPIREFIDKYIAKLPAEPIIVDPFARNGKIGNLTNDLNPDTGAMFHMDSTDFLNMIVEEGTKVDMVLFDPPYSPHQVKQLYQGIGRELTRLDTQRTGYWAAEKDAINKMLKPGGYVLSFNWNTQGMCKKRGFEQLEVLVVCHGACHNDTLCVAEIKTGAPTES